MVTVSEAQMLDKIPSIFFSVVLTKSRTLGVVS